MRNYFCKFFMLVASILIAACSHTPQKNGQDQSFVNTTRDLRDHSPEQMRVHGYPIKEDQIDPVYMQSQADYHFTLGENYSYDGQPELAIENFKRALIFDNKSPHLFTRLAKEYLKVGLVSEALNVAEKAYERDKKNKESLTLLGGIYSSLKMYDKAFEFYNSVLQLDPADTQAPVYLGALMVEKGDYAKAVRYFDALAKNPKNNKKHLAYYYKGRVHLEEPGSSATSLKNANAAFAKALEHMPNFSDALVSMVEILEAQNKNSEALNLMKSFQVRHGPVAEIAEKMGRVYLMKGENQNALEQYSLLESLEPQNLNAKIKVAFIFIEVKQYDEAIGKLQEILSVVPDSDRIRFYLGAIYEEVKDYPSAIEQFLMITPHSGYYDEATVHASYLYRLMGNYDKAISILDKALTFKNDNPQFYLLYASYLDELKQMNKAADFLAKAVDRFPDHVRLVFFYGSVLGQLGETEKTITQMRRVIDLDQNHVQALNFLAYTYAEKNILLDDAEVMVRRALKLKPNDGYILDTLGWVLYKQGNIPEAIKVLEAAYNLQSNEGIIAEHLADAYYKGQAFQKAIEMYVKASQIVGNGKENENLQRKIAEVRIQLEKQKSIARPQRLPASVSPTSN